MRKSVALATLLLASRAWGDGNEAAAASLFDQGLADMEAGRLEGACPKIAESHRLDPRAGTLFTLAECEARAGKVASAVVHYTDYVARAARSPDSAKQKERVLIAERQLALLRPKVPELTIVVTGGLPEGATVKRDGIVLGGPSLGTALPVDPGPHELSIVLSDGRVRRETFVLEAGEKRRVELAPPTSAPTPPDGTSKITTPPPPPPPASSGGHLGLTIASGALALTGLTVGVITGAMTLGKKSSIDANCNGTVCNAVGKDAADAAGGLGLVSTVGFIAGGVFAATTLVLFLTEPSGVRVGVGWNRVQVEASW